MTLATGRQGENIARDYVKKEGMRILEQNYRALRGEIDMIAMDADCIVFIEVKTNSPSNPVSPELRVTLSKQKQIGKIARKYLQDTGNTGSDCRFDVIGIVLRNNGRHDITHIRSAFWLPREV